MRQLFRLSPLGVLGGLSSGIIIGVVYGLMPIYIAQHFSVGFVAIFMAAIILGGAVLQYPIGWLSDRFDRRVVLTGVSLFATLCAFLLVFVSSVGAVFIAFFFFGGLTFAL